MILCDLYMGHEMSVFIITVVSLLYIRKNLSSHFILQLKLIHQIQTCCDSVLCVNVTGHIRIDDAPELF